MRRHVLVALLVVLSLGGAQAQPAPAATPALPFAVTACVRTATPPVIDGKLTEACWQATRPMRPFVKLTLGTPADVQSTAYLAYDSTRLYVGVHCQEPQMASVKAETTKRDGAVCADDCIEIFLVPPDSSVLARFNEQDRYFHLVVNTLGTRYDEIGLEAPTVFDGQWEASVSKGADSWELEVAVPFSELGATVREGSVWTGNVCRARWAEHEYSTWAPIKRTFHDRVNFGRLVFTEQLSSVAGRLDEIECAAVKSGLLAPALTEAMQAVQVARATAGGLPANCRPRIEEAVSGLQGRLSSLQRRVAGLTPQSFRARWPRLYARLEPLRAEAASLEDEAVMLAATRGGLRPWHFFVTRAITNERLLSDRWPRKPAKLPRLALTACPGEYESATFSVYALRDLADVTLAIGDLRAGDRVLPASCVAPYAVKCWYQAGRGIGDPGGKLLTPELLLRDDSLVKVDYRQQQNLVRAQPGSTDYLDCTVKDSSNLAGLTPRDADSLLPLAIPARTLKQFWLTAHVPANAAAGTYRGTVTVSATGLPPEKLPLEITVLPFKLAEPAVQYSIYYRGVLTAEGKPSISSEHKSSEQFAAEMRDMVAHGVVNPTIYQGYDDRLLPEVFDLREAAGMKNKSVLTLGVATGAPTTAQGLEELQKNVRRWLAFIHQRGYQDLYVYGIDEASGDALKAERAAFTAVHDAGGRVFVACYKDYFGLVGDLLDLPVWAGRPDPEEARKAHGVGHRIFDYANPQCGVEEPETYRRNFGLLLWKSGYDGAMDYAYQHSFHHAWDDFDDPSYRDHIMAYPTANGVIDTVQWEGFREGVDDVRYVTTLLQAVKTAQAAGGAKAKQATAAQAWVQSLNPDADLDTLRAGMVRRILELTE